MSSTSAMDAAIRAACRVEIEAHVRNAEMLMTQSLMLCALVYENREHLDMEFVRWVAQCQIFMGVCALRLAYDMQDL